VPFVCKRQLVAADFEKLGLPSILNEGIVVILDELFNRLFEVPRVEVAILQKHIQDNLVGLLFNDVFMLAFRLRVFRDASARFNLSSIVGRLLAAPLA